MTPRELAQQRYRSAISLRPHASMDAKPERSGTFRAEVSGDTITLWIYDIIDEWFGVSAEEFAKTLAESTQLNILVKINSPGGAVFDGFAIYNALAAEQMKGRHVRVSIDGLAASAASLIAMVGEETTMQANSFMMIHKAWTFAAGNADELRSTADILDSLDTQLAVTYAKRTGLTVDEITAMLTAETWFSAPEAVEKGFAQKFNEPQGAPEDTDPEDEGSQSASDEEVGLVRARLANALIAQEG